MTYWNPDCDKSWCLKPRAEWGMFTSWGNQRVSNIVERAANLAALGSSADAVLSWIRQNLSAETDESITLTVRESIASALDIVWVAEYGESFAPGLLVGVTTAR